MSRKPNRRGYTRKAAAAATTPTTTRHTKKKGGGTRRGRKPKRPFSPVSREPSPPDLPPTLQFGSSTLNVTSESLHGDCIGLYRYHKHKIIVDPSLQGTSLELVVFLHEIIHVWLTRLGLAPLLEKLTGSEEGICDNLGWFLADLLLQNPAFRTYVEELANYLESQASASSS